MHEVDHTRLFRRLRTIVLLAAIAAVLACVWLIGYHSRKSNDNLPTLSLLTDMEETSANDLIAGYRRTQLREVWGSPALTGDSYDTWLSKDGRQVTVRYDGRSIAQSAQVTDSPTST